jgi:hypothetical protein
MTHSSILPSAVLAAAICFVPSSSAFCHQSALEAKDPEDALLGKLEPFIANGIKPEPSDSPLRKLQKERCRQRAIALAKYQTLMEIGKSDPSDNAEKLRVSTALAENLLDVFDKPADKLKCYEMRVDALKGMEKFAAQRVEMGTEPSQSLNIAKAARIDAEIELLKFQSSLEKSRKLADRPPLTHRSRCLQDWRSSDS